MDESSKRRSRMHRAAVGKRIELTPRDLELFKLLSRYRYLRSNFLYVFLGGASEKRFIERLGHLYHDGRYINRPAQQWQFANCRYMPAIYELDDAGNQALLDHGIAEDRQVFRKRCGKPSGQFAHTLMINEIVASIELGVRNSRLLRFISAEEIIARAPEATRLDDNPFAIPVSLTHTFPGTKKALHADLKLIPDALFGLEYSGKAYRFFALEADRNTMPCVRAGLRQSSYFRKLLAYRAIAAGQLYKSRFGIPNLLVLNVTTNDEHMRVIMALLKELAGGSTMFLFKALPMFGNIQCAPSPYPRILTEPWHRVGYEPMPISH